MEHYYPEAEAINRFKVFSKKYPRLWKKYIRDTSKSAFTNYSESLIIPQLRLVQFLMEVNQITLAKLVIEEMINLVIGDFSDQPLKTPKWIQPIKIEAQLFTLIGLSRFKLPCPMIKLQYIHGLARLLEDPILSANAFKSMIYWISTLDLESEVLEVLSALLLINPTSVSKISTFRNTINRPSILSDIFLSNSFKTPILINSWVKCHSGEVPAFYENKILKSELMRGQIIPKIFSSRLYKLEKKSRCPFINQWVFEFERILARTGEQTNGHWSYFLGSDRENEVGQFIGRRSHVARSAYLRTLACASDIWGMPDELLLEEAMHASPVDVSFLKMLPAAIPKWISSFHHQCPRSHPDFENILTSILSANELTNNENKLLFLNIPLNKSELYQADFKLITILYKGKLPAAEVAFSLFDLMLGEIYIDRSEEFDFIIEYRDDIEEIEVNSDCKILPALIPAIGRHIGYVHSDIIGRMPYFPLNYSKERLIANPRNGGADFVYSGTNIGSFEYWNLRWQPTHHYELGTHGGVYVTLSSSAISSLFDVPDMKLARVWKSTVLTRESNYGEWEREIKYGISNFE